MQYSSLQVRSFCALLALAGAMQSANVNADQACFSIPAPAAIPDNNPTGITKTLTLPANAVIQDLNVSLNITHTFVGDLKVTLRHVESGTTIDLINRMVLSPVSLSSCSSNNLNVVLDDQGTGGAMHSTCGASSGALTPISPPNYTPKMPLSNFNGQSINGNWELKVSDVVSVDTGTLNFACLTWNSTDVAVTTNYPASVAAAGSLVQYQVSITNNGPYDQEQATVLDYGPMATLLSFYSLPRGTATFQNAAGPTFGTNGFFLIPNLLVGEQLNIQMFLATSKIRTSLGGPIPDSTVLKVNSSSGGAPKELPNYPLNFDTALHPSNVSGDVVLVDDGNATDPGALTSDACQPLLNGAAVAGKIALVDSIFAPLPTYSGTPPPCSYSTALTNVLAAGAKGLVLINATDNAFPIFSPPVPPPTGITIPVVFVGKKFGNQLKAGANVSLFVGKAGVWEVFGQTISSSSDDTNSSNDLAFSMLVIGDDADSDGSADAVDFCELDNAKVVPGVCGCGKVDIVQDVNVNGLADCNEAPSALVPPAPKIKQKTGAITVTFPKITGASVVVKFLIKAPGAKKAKKKTVTSTKNVVSLTKLAKGTSITVSYHFNLSSPAVSSSLESGEVKVKLKK